MNSIRDQTFKNAHVKSLQSLWSDNVEQKILISQKMMVDSHAKKYPDQTPLETHGYKVGHTVQYLNLPKNQSIGRKLEPTWLPLNGYLVIAKIAEHGQTVYMRDPVNPNKKLKRRWIEQVRRFPGYPKIITRAKGGPKSRVNRKRKRVWCFEKSSEITCRNFLQKFLKFVVSRKMSAKNSTPGLSDQLYADYVAYLKNGTIPEDVSSTVANFTRDAKKYEVKSGVLIRKRKLVLKKSELGKVWKSHHIDLLHPGELF